MPLPVPYKRESYTARKLLAGDGSVHPRELKKCKAKHLTSKLLPAATGSVGMDLASRELVTLMISSVHLVPTGVWGALGNNIHALLIGHSSATKLGLFVLPGVIDLIMRE